MQNKLGFIFILERKYLRRSQRYKKNERNAKEKTFSFHFRVQSIFGKAKDTKKRAKCKRKNVFFFLFTNTTGSVPLCLKNFGKERLLDKKVRKREELFGS